MRPRPLRILWCETYDDGTVGGSHACMFNVATRLEASRYQIVAGFCRPNAYAARFAAKGIPTVLVPGIVERGPGLWARVAAFASRHRLPRVVARILQDHRIDLVVLNNSVFVSHGFMEPCFARGVPVVAYERGLGTIGPERAPTVTLTAQLAASVAISRAVQENLVRGGFQSPRIEVIYDGIDLATTSRADRAAVRARVGLAPDHEVIGMLGNVRHWKGQHVFVEAFGRLARTRPALRGLIVGAWSAGDRDYHAQLTARIAELGLTERLRLLGFRTDVPDLLQAMDVVVHASVTPEPWGMVLLEAMAAARPVVATAMGGPLEMLEDGRCGALVPPEDPPAMATAVARYLDDGTYRAEVVQRARARVEATFHIRDTVAHTARLFDQVVA